MFLILKKIRKENKGTALLTAMMIMGVLVSISLALSSLIFRETRLVGELMDSGRAYYAAESGIEKALYHLNNELPGWQENFQGNLSEETSYDYEVRNACKSYPCFDSDEYSLTDVPTEELYGKLQLNETITIPLFIVSSEGEVKSVENFTVEFFAGFDAQSALKFKGDISAWDVLRWKVFGMKDVGGKFVTDSISDFTAISVARNLNTGEEYSTSAKNPSWFGSKSCETTNGIECSGYSLPDFLSKGGDNCASPSLMSRDYYEYVDGEVKVIHDCYSISDFMLSHQTDTNGAKGLNYLVLTNLMNPEMFDLDYLYAQGLNGEEASTIYFRVETYDDDVVREIAEITADGYSGKMKQSIKVNIRRGSYMPVFNFAIYSTYKNAEDKALYDGAGE